MSHRLPPKPPWFDNPGKGNCRWCGEPVTGKRLKWHNACLAEYQLLFWPNVTRAWMFEQAHGTCQGCGVLLSRKCLLLGRRLTPEISTTYHVEAPGAVHHLDHIIPLTDYPHDPQDPYAAWRPGNLQILCEDCHKAKTAREASERAARKRQESREELPLMKICNAG